MFVWLMDHAWIAEIAIFLCVLWALNFLLKMALVRVKKKAHLKETDWRTHLENAAAMPARALLWVFLIAFLIDVAARQLDLQHSFAWVFSLRNVGIVFLLAWFLLRWKRIFFNAIAAQRVKGKPSFDPVSMEVVGKFYTFGVLFVSLLVILQIFGLDIIPLITFGGIGAAALGFASKDVVASFFGGLMLTVTRPFTVGDLIELPERKISGHIEDIGWYFTSLRDLQKQPIYIPNSAFSKEILVNLSRITHRKIDESIHLRFADASKVEPIVETIRELLAQHPEIDDQQPVHVYLAALTPYALELEIRAYTLTTRYEEFMEIKQKILLEIYHLIHKSGASIALPSLSFELKR